MHEHRKSTFEWFGRLLRLSAAAKVRAKAEKRVAFESSIDNLAISPCSH